MTYIALEQALWVFKSQTPQNNKSHLGFRPIAPRETHHDSVGDLNGFSSENEHVAPPTARSRRARAFCANSSATSDPDDSQHPYRRPQSPKHNFSRSSRRTACPHSTYTHWRVGRKAPSWGDNPTPYLRNLSEDAHNGFVAKNAAFYVWPYGRERGAGSELTRTFR